MSRNNEFSVTAGIPDDEFIRGDVPMTKEEVRVLSISKLQLEEDDRILDIGAGTGSMSIEMALLLPQSPVYAVEYKENALELIRLNAHKFGTQNVYAIAGKAPDVLDQPLNINKVFIGGSGGNLREIIEWVKRNTLEDARVVINAISLDTLITARECLSCPDFEDLEIIQVSVNKIENVGNSDMFRPQSPVFIISATRVEQDNEDSL